MNDKTLAGAHGSPLIRAVTFLTCGTCIYAQPSNSNVHDCHGNPPSVHVIGVARPDQLGRTGLQLEMFVPKVRGDRPACALHKRKDDFATMGNS